MGLVVWDGFEKYNSITDAQQRFGALQWTNLTTGAITSPGRGGYGKCLQSGGSFQNIIAALATPIQQITFGFGINFLGQANVLNVYLTDNLASGAQQCQWVINSGTGAISFINAAGATVGTALNSIGPNGWYFVEMQVGIGTSAGSAALRINGQAIASFSGLTNIDTQSTSNASVSGITFHSGQNNTFEFDDFYVCDGTTGPGSYPANSFLGDTRVSTLFPISNSAVSWTPLTGANWQEVSETAMDSDTSYNYTATAGAKDVFNFGALVANVNQVIGLELTVAVRKEDAGARTVAPVLVIGGTTYQGTAVSVDVSYLYITSEWPINPHTSASWTASDINALIAGYVVVT